MKEIIAYLTANWPGLTVFVLGIVALYWVFKSVIDAQKIAVESIRTANQDLRENVTGLKTKIAELTESDVNSTAKIEALEKSMMEYKREVSARFAEISQFNEQLKILLNESFDRFNKLSDTLSDVASALQTLDGRQVETWNQVEQVLKNHGFQLEQVRLLIDRLSARALAGSAEGVLITDVLT